MKLKNELLKYLEDIGIDFKETKHPPLFHVGDEEKYGISLDGMECKCLFLREKKKDNYYLVVLGGDKKVKLNDLRRSLGVKEWKFADAEEMNFKIAVSPGSVTPFAIFKNEENDVVLILDEDIVNSDKVNFHPMVNTATVTLLGKDLIKFVESEGNEYRIVNINSI
jgi:Ala-tRNA(Pro) deacylase